jgi:pimeloyl-ACP methyl ester carboxylesterase
MAPTQRAEQVVGSTGEQGKQDRAESVRQPLVLLHGLGMSTRVWDSVRGLLEPRHEVIALPTLGHRGGAAPSKRPVTIVDLVADAERALDEHGLQRPHIAGNSLGGWMAIELARRGRARTVCALSPAGFWSSGTDEQMIGVRKIRRAVRTARLGRPLPFMLRSRRVRRFVFRDIAVHGDRLTATQAIEATNDLLDCVIVHDVLTTDENIAPLHPLPCPITLAWSAQDAIVPVDVNGVVARRSLPQARFIVLPGVGHVPMIDNPEIVARTILEATAAVDDRTEHA